MLEILREGVDKIKSERNNVSLLSEFVTDAYAEDDFMEVSVDLMSDEEKKKLSSIIDKAIPEDTTDDDTGLTKDDIENATKLMHDPTIEELADEMI